MTTEEKMEILFEIFENEDIATDTPLDTLQWDSMTIMSVMVHALNNGHKLAAADLRAMKTVGEVVAAM